uniref:Uncharacterized protein n=1 Tax=Echinococcus granulosus TaxID=6210 RepID=A0A068WYX4_ECHGR|nr:hypothetical protein EgrG_002059100 [Echinococcus granulosus]
MGRAGDAPTAFRRLDKPKPNGRPAGQPPPPTAGSHLVVWPQSPTPPQPAKPPTVWSQHNSHQWLVDYQYTPARSSTGTPLRLLLTSCNRARQILLSLHPSIHPSIYPLVHQSSSREEEDYHEDMTRPPQTASLTRRGVHDREDAQTARPKDEWHASAPVRHAQHRPQPRIHLPTPPRLPT